MNIYENKLISTTRDRHKSQSLNWGQIKILARRFRVVLASHMIMLYFSLHSSLSLSKRPHNLMIIINSFNIQVL